MDSLLLLGVLRLTIILIFFAAFFVSLYLFLRKYIKSLHYHEAKEEGLSDWYYIGNALWDSKLRMVLVFVICLLFYVTITNYTVFGPKSQLDGTNPVLEQRLKETDSNPVILPEATPLPSLSDKVREKQGVSREENKSIKESFMKLPTVSPSN